MSAPPPMPPSRWNWERLLRPLIYLAVVLLVGVSVVFIARGLGEALGDRLGDNSTTPTTFTPNVEVVVVIPRGAVASQIAELLTEAGVVSSESVFQTAVRTTGADAQLQAGTYRLFTGMNPEEVVTELQRGPQISTLDVTIPEGLRVTEILEILAQSTTIDRTSLEAALTQGRVVTGVAELPEQPQLSDWEGLLFPDTYRFFAESTAAEILNRMAQTTEQRMDEVDWSELTDAGFSRYQGLVIASLIESEVRVDEERALVSSVIRNRLDREMRLEIDATVLYALGTRDVSMFDNTVVSPYNSYAVVGLPPTPISAPGMTSLAAAAAPANTDFIYYVLSDTSGRHTFSRTFAEHQAAVEQSRRDGILP